MGVAAPVVAVPVVDVPVEPVMPDPIEPVVGSGVIVPVELPVDIEPLVLVPGIEVDIDPLVLVPVVVLVEPERPRVLRPREVMVPVVD